MAFSAYISKPTKGTIDYHNGILTGDNALLVEWIIEEADAWEGPIGDMNYSPAGSFLSDPLAVYLLISELFESATFSGEVPEYPELEEGQKG